MSQLADTKRVITVCCSTARHGCGKLFVPVREFQKACCSTCVLNMLDFMAVERLRARRLLQRQPVAPTTGEPAKKRRRRRRKKAVPKP